MFQIADIEGLIPTSDKDYDKLRNMLKVQGISFEQLVKK
jgi:hypothetical protein